MTAYVHNRAPSTMIGSLAPTGVQIGKPVAGSRWTSGAYLANYLMGIGGSLIPSTSPGNRTHAAGTSTTYHYYIWPRYNCVMRLWVLTLLSGDEDAASGDFNVEGVQLGEWLLPADLATVRSPHAFFYWETVSKSSVATNTYFTLDVDSTSGAPVTIVSVGCYEVPRYYLAQDSNEAGADIETTFSGNTIRSDADGDAPATYASMCGVKYSSFSAAVSCRRNGHFHWYDPDGRETSGTSYIDLFPLYPEALGRKIYSGDGAGQTQGRTLEVMVIGYIDGAESVSDAFKVITVSGNSAAVTMTSTLTWYGPIEIDVDCEDLTDAKGLRDATWETLRFQIAGGENAGTVYGVSVGEP